MRTRGLAAIEGDETEALEDFRGLDVAGALGAQDVERDQERPLDFGVVADEPRRLGQRPVEIRGIRAGGELEPALAQAPRGLRVPGREVRAGELVQETRCRIARARSRSGIARSYSPRFR